MFRGLVQACLAPFRRPGAALIAGLLMVGLPLLSSVAVGFLGQVWANGGTFLTPGSRGDPILYQHLLWVVWHPETQRVLTAISVLFLGPVAYAIWWRGLNGKHHRLRLVAVMRVALWIWLALSVMLLNAVYFAMFPVALPFTDGIVLVALTVVSLVLLARFQPQIAGALGATSAAQPGWGAALAMAALILLVGFVAQLVAVFASLGTTALGSIAFGGPDRGLPSWVFALLLLDWQHIFAQIAFAYTALIAVAFLNAPHGQAVPFRINRQ